MNIDFSTFIMSLASAAMMSLGLAPKPDTGKQEVDLGMAHHNIALLELLKEKTKNNLSQDESKLLESLLFECRTKFLDESKKK